MGTLTSCVEVEQFNNHRDVIRALSVLLAALQESIKSCTIFAEHIDPIALEHSETMTVTTPIGRCNTVFLANVHARRRIGVKCEIWDRFSTQFAFDELWFRKGV